MAFRCNFDGIRQDESTGFGAYPAILGGVIENSLNDSIVNNWTPRRYGHLPLSDYQYVENDGIARIIAYSQGQDANGDTIRVWDQMTVVYSGLVGYNDDAQDSFTTPDNILYRGESRTVVFSLMDNNGNPVQSGTKISAWLSADVTAALSWTELETGGDWGTCYYTIGISNAISGATTEPKPGLTDILIRVENPNQGATFTTTRSIYISMDERP
jgi:hypothetical protein